MASIESLQPLPFSGHQITFESYDSLLVVCATPHGFTRLPTEVAVEVLSNLPTLCILRQRRVCCRFKNIIDHPTNQNGLFMPGIQHNIARLQEFCHEVLLLGREGRTISFLDAFIGYARHYGIHGNTGARLDAAHAFATVWLRFWTVGKPDAMPFDPVSQSWDLCKLSAVACALQTFHLYKKADLPDPGAGLGRELMILGALAWNARDVLGMDEALVQDYVQQVCSDHSPFDDCIVWAANSTASGSVSASFAVSRPDNGDGRLAQPLWPKIDGICNCRQLADVLGIPELPDVLELGYGVRSIATWNLACRAVDSQLNLTQRQRAVVLDEIFICQR